MIKILNSKEIKKNFDLHTSIAIDLKIKETVLAEICAAKTIRRNTLIKRVENLLHPLEQVTDSIIENILNKLEYEGCVTKGPGGLIAAAPLRVIEKDNTTFLIVSSLPLSIIEEDLGVSFEDYDNNIATLKKGTGETLAEKVEALNGVLISAETWAGLDQMMNAGEEWLEFINEQSFHTAERSADYFRHLIDETSWQCYWPEASDKNEYQRWKKISKIEHTDLSLWRAKYNMRNWIYLWSDKRLVSDFQGYPLSYDEAIRTQFSVDMKKELPKVGKVLSLSKSSFGISLDFRIPKSRYRYLCTIADQLGTVSGDKDEVSGFIFNKKEQLEEARDLLTDRLTVNWVSK